MTAAPAMADDLAIEIEIPGGSATIRLFRHFLLRSTGLDVCPLLELGSLTPARDSAECEDPGLSQQEHAQRLDSCLSILRKAMEDPRIREAVSLSNPSYYEYALAQGRPLRAADGSWAELNKRGRKEARTAHRYLRRLLGKTESNSFFGPTLRANWDAHAPEPVQTGEPTTERVVPGLSYWVVAELAKQLRRRLPGSERGWRRSPLWRIDESRAVLHSALDTVHVEADPAVRAVWDALSEPGTTEQLRQRTGLPGSELVAALKRLRPAMHGWPEPPSTVIDPLCWLRETYPQAPLPARLAELVADAANTPWPSSLERWNAVRGEIAAAGCATSRSGGQHYADRDVFNEDRSSPWNGRVTLGRPAVESVHRSLADIMPLMLLDALLRQSDAREAVAKSTEGRVSGLVELAARDIPQVTWRADALRDQLEGVLPSATKSTMESCHLDPETVGAVLAPLWELVDFTDGDIRACVPGFDLMVAGGAPGRGQWVLSECHDDSSSALGGITSRAQPPGGFAEFCRDLSAWLDTSAMATVVGRRRSRHITPELPGLSIELSGGSCKPAGQIAPAAEVEVSAEGHRLLYRGRSYQLYPGDVPGPLFTALSLPCVVAPVLGAGRAHMARIVLGDTILQRARWRLDLPELGRDLKAWVAADRWRLENDLPRRVFLRHPDEPKPLLIDFSDPLGVDDLSRLRPATVDCSEVLPDYRDTWCPAGRQPCELRVPVFLRWQTTAGRVE